MLQTREITIMTQDPNIFEEESLTLHHVAYNIESKQIFVENVNTKNKKSSKQWKY